MIKTILLSADVEKTVAVNKKYVLVKNMSASAVYVSQSASITADAEGVQCILPLSSELVKDVILSSVDITTNTDVYGNLYFKCADNTKIEIQTSSDANFKKYSKGGEFGKSFSQEKILTLTRLKALNTTGTWLNNVYTVNGIAWTCTVEGDEVKSINANGTATAISTLLVKNPNNPAVLLDTTKKYLLQGCPSGGSTTTYFMRLQVYQDLAGTTWNANHDDVGSGKVFTPNHAFYNCILRVASGVTVSNKVFTPKLLLDSCYM